MNEKFVNVQKKAIQYWFIDGLAELAAGLIGIFLAVLFWVWHQVFTWRWSLPVILVAAFAVSFGLRLIIQRIKVRSTYPLTGYVSPFSGLESKWSVVILIAFSLVLLGLNYLFSTQGSQGLIWSPGLAGIIFTFIFVWTGATTKLKRFFILAIISLILGLILVLLKLDYFQGVSVLTEIVGLVLLVQGYQVRKIYLQQSQQMNEAINE
ncbi:MAG: hypothetical protein CVU41_12530 [Chloroflexi bacterium HGW-Chloroflexi-3]|nr:MAG: hypothetical protein CVU41_12530 [Chloroflexi bacterium HGW-Chloroflexi-3]